MIKLIMATLLFSSSGCANITIEHKRGAHPEKVITYYESHHLNDGKNCYFKALQNNKNLRGRVSLEWTVNDKGQVLKTKVIEDTFQESQVSQCLVEHLKAIRFPPTPYNSKAIIEYGYNFQASGTQ